MNELLQNDIEYVAISGDKGPLKDEKGWRWDLEKLLT